MRATGFDRLARNLGHRQTRRSAIAAAFAGIVSGVTGVATPNEAAAFRRSCRTFAISGSQSIRKSFIYDDDLRITLRRRGGGKESLLNDTDGEIGVGNESVAPLTFEARPGDSLHIVARDRTANCYSMDGLFLHCCKDEKCKSSREWVRLARPVKRTCVDAAEWTPSTFYNEKFKIPGQSRRRRTR